MQRYYDAVTNYGAACHNEMKWIFHNIQGVVRIIETHDFVIIVICNIHFIFSRIDL